MQCRSRQVNEYASPPPTPTPADVPLDDRWMDGCTDGRSMNDDDD